MMLWILLALVLDLLFTIGTYGSSERLRHNVETLTADDRRLRASATTRTDTQTQDAFQSIVDALPEIDAAAPPLIHFARPRRHPLARP